MRRETCRFVWPSRLNKFLTPAVKKAQLQPARGFDRLASVGFSEADIANFRLQFHSQSASNYLDTDFETEEECTLRFH